jgi:hypothetical protein
MKTADSIEQQEERKQARDNEHSSPANKRSNTRSKRGGDFSRIAAWAWKPGQSGNPNGRPKHDLAAEVARAIFENNPDMVYKAFCKAIAKGNDYAFQVLADRGYGKLKETIHAEIGPYHGQTDEELRKRLHELEQKLGYVRVLPPSDEPKPN